MDNLINGPAPVDYNLNNDGVSNSYDGKYLSNGECAWKKGNCNPQMLNRDMFVYQGTQLPLENEMKSMKPPEDSMFMFSYNTVSPNCYSTFSTNRGQVCLTKEQIDLISKNRGGNKTSYGCLKDHHDF